MPQHLPESFLVLLIFPSLLITGGEEVPIRVNGLIKQFIFLSLPEDPSRSVEQIFWNFQTNIFAYYMNSQLKVMENDFKGRLEMLDNGGTLRIGQLRLEDSGLYTGTISFTDGTVHTTSYNLTVYEPVPVPSIEIADLKKTSDLCNVTLHCSVSKNTSTLFYTWKYRHGNSDYQQYNNYGDTIQMSLKNDKDKEVMCIVQNPADHKNVSLQTICLDYNMKGRNPGGVTCWVKLYIYLPILTILSLSLPLLCLLNRRKPE